jgi:hypothetical protein
MGILKTQDVPAHSDELLVRMSLYLQCAGLPETHASAKAAVLLKEFCATTRNGKSPPDASGALDRLAFRYREWLAYLCRSAGADTDARPEILACRLRPVLHEHPESFLEHGRLPEAVHIAVKESTRQAVPKEQRLPMPTQVIAEPPRLLQAAWWRHYLFDVRFTPWHRGHRRIQKGR